VLTSPKGSELWRSSEFTSSRISRGLMKDDGNFQLRDKNSVVLWQSFDNFTDTLVPGQTLNLNNYLYSRQGEFNFSRGRFELCLQDNGDVILVDLINFPTKKNCSAKQDTYYDSGIVDSYNQSPNVGQRFMFDRLEFFLYILKHNGEKFSLLKIPDTVSKDKFYYKATMNYDGVFTLSYHPKDLKNGQNWIVAKTSSIPENICLNSTSTNGQGICGFNSICSLRDDQRPMCSCVEGYSLIDSNNMYGGCVSNFHENCQGRNRSSQNDTHGHGGDMIELPNTFWPKFDYEPLSPCSLEECKDYCKQDCSCVLVFSMKVLVGRRSYHFHMGEKI
jgi:hypothetical protein